jgi:hypothetical protein
MNKKGFVYIVLNPVYKVGSRKLIKIGKTLDIKKRLRDLSRNAGVPDDFKCLFLFQCNNPRTIELAAHRHFKHLRYNSRKEFFTANLKDVINFVKKFDGEVCDLKEHVYNHPLAKLPAKKMNNISENKKKEIRKYLRQGLKQYEVVELTKTTKHHVGKVAKEMRESFSLQTNKSMA